MPAEIPADPLEQIPYELPLRQNLLEHHPRRESILAQAPIPQDRKTLDRKLRGRARPRLLIGA